MAELTVFLAGALALAALAFTGGWFLRGLRGRMRAEARRDAERDDRHA